MRVKAKNVHGQMDHPAGTMFQRLIYPGQVFDIPDEPVVHEIDEVDPVTNKPTGKKLRNIIYNKERNGQVKEMTELEIRKYHVANNPECRRWSAKDKQLYLQIRAYSPTWMEPVPVGVKTTVNPQLSEPTGPEDETEKVSDPKPEAPVLPQGTADLVALSDKKAIDLVNKTKDVKTLETWIALEQAAPKPRVNVLSVLEAQLKTAAGQ